MSLRPAHNSNWRIAVFLLLAGTVFLPGCGGSGLPGPTGTVTGKVTYNGNAIPAGSTITFMHEETSLPAVGEISADGSYSLKMRGGDEILAGKYKISVVPAATGVADENTDMEAYKAMMEGGGTAATPEPFPKKYQSAETSGETFEVKEGESNTYDLDMKDGDAPAEPAVE
jgi:hypothetical protein